MKAENVFFVSETQVKVGDFGFSTQETETALDTFCGSPPYAAPELFGDQKYSGPLVDIWAMGVLLFFMLSGNMPFVAENVPRLKEKIQAGHYQTPKSLTPACAELVAGILVTDAGERYTMDDICNSWWLQGSECSNDRDAQTDQSVLLASFNAGDSVDPEIVQWLEQVGVPTVDRDTILGEPRNPVAGSYRILLHRKHLASLKLATAPQENGRVQFDRVHSQPEGKRKDLRTSTAEPPLEDGGRKRSRICVIL